MFVDFTHLNGKLVFLAGNIRHFCYMLFTIELCRSYFID